MKIFYESREVVENASGRDDAGTLTYSTDWQGISPLGRLVSQIACRAMDDPNLQRFLINPQMDLAPTSRDIPLERPDGEWTRRLGPPYLRAYHSPSPSTLTPVLSAARQGPEKHDPERG